MKHRTKAIICSISAALALALACEPTGGTDGTTSWLGPCGTTPECGLFLECMCGACSAECTTDADCAGLDPGAVCAPIAAIECTDAPATSGVCSLRCDQGSDCPRGAGCVGGYCWPGVSSGDDRDAAPEASVSVDAGSGGAGATGGAPEAGPGGTGGAVDAGVGAAGSGGAGAGGTGPDAAAGSAGVGAGGAGGVASGPDASVDGSMDGGTTEGPDAAVCEAPICKPGALVCDGFCIDPSIEERHCGAALDCALGNAGASCDPSERCKAGTCVQDCVSPLRPPRFIPVDDKPTALSLGDLNHDGKLDLAVAHRGETLKILLGRGDGGFDPAGDYVTTSADAAYGIPIAVAAGDFDGDGHPDLAVGNSEGSIDAFIGNGDGTFQGAVNTPSSTVWWLAIHDVDGDCRDDVVAALSVVTGERPHIVIHRSNGDGTFAAPEDTGVKGYMAALADLDGDGRSDLVAPDFDTVHVALRNGSGGFDAPVPYTAGAYSRWVSVPDIDRDGIPDLVVTNDDSRDVSVLRGNGDGTFAPANHYGIGVVDPPCYSPAVHAIGDLDGNGTPDVAVGCENGYTLIPMLNDGSGALERGPVIDAPMTSSLAAGDLNADGRDDVASVVRTADTVSVVLGASTADFADAVNYPAATFAEGMATADIDGKNGPDIVLADYNGKRVGTLLNNGDGTFQTMLEAATGTRHVAIAVGDVDVDGIPDVVTTHQMDLGMSVLLGNGNGTYAPAADPLPGIFTYAVAIAHMNGDTNPDLVVSTSPSPGSGINQVVVLLGNGDGTFTPLAPYLVTGAGVLSLSITDLDGDGASDVLLPVVQDALGGAGDLHVLLGNGDGTLQPFINVPVGGDYGPQRVFPGDLNGDGHLDLALHMYFGGPHVLLGTGAGSGGGVFFQPSFPVRSLPVEALADFDGDGRLDAVGVSDDDLFGIAFGDGTGDLHGHVLYPAGDFPALATAADFNGDGLMDVATSNVIGRDVSVALGVPVCQGP